MRKSIFIVIKKRHVYFILVGIIGAILLPTAVIARIGGKVPAQRLGPLSGKKIVVDAGHGGVDGGAFHGELLEKDINLHIAQMLMLHLEKEGASVIMTREEDNSLDDQKRNGSRHREDLNARSQIINKNRADLFISIHGNSLKQKPERFGPIVFYYTSSEKSKLLANLIQKELNRLKAYQERSLQINQREMPGTYYILRTTKSPGVIVETGFISNSLDRELLQEASHQENTAEAITKAVIEYFRVEKEVHRNGK